MTGIMFCQQTGSSSLGPTYKHKWGKKAMGLMHNYVIQCMRVRLGGIAKQVP